MAEPTLSIASVILLAFAILAGRRSLRVMRLVKRLGALRPTRIADAPEGTLQVIHGRVSSPAPIPSAFQRRAAAYYAFRVEEPRPEPQKPRRLAVGKDWAPLVIEDESGSADVESRPAYIQAPHEHVRSLGKLAKIPIEHTAFFEAAGIHERHLARFANVRIVEYTLEPSDAVYVLGTVRSENGRKVFYRATHSPLAVSQNIDPGLVPGYRNELLLFSVAALLLVLFSAVFFVVSLA